MTPSDLCDEWVKHCETCSLKAYWDVDGWSIGWGYHGPEIAEDTVWTQEQADAQRRESLAKAGNTVARMVRVALTQGQMDALTDFVYNLGSGNLQDSAMFRLLNVGLYDSAYRELYWEDPDGNPHGWIFSGGKVNAGLIARRKGDQILWKGGNPLESA